MIVAAIALVAAFDSSILGWFSVIALVAAACWLVGRFIRWRSTYFVITNDRVIYRSGVFRKSGMQIPLERVNNVNFEQSLLERVVGAGDLLIESGGMDGPARSPTCATPTRSRTSCTTPSRRTPRGITTSAGEMPSGPAAQPPVASTPCRRRRRRGQPAREAGGLMQRGTITREEFEAQKRRLLGE